MTTPQTADIVAFGGTSAPTNWLLCNGAAVSRTTYAALFAAIGTTFGSGDGSTTFNVPQLAFRFPRGTTSGSLGGTGGALDHTHAATASHKHPLVMAANHADHATQGAHTHDSHTTQSRGTTVATQPANNAPITHTSVGGHNHAGGHIHTHLEGETAVTTPGSTGSNNPPFQTTFFIIRT